MMDRKEKLLQHIAEKEHYKEAKILKVGGTSAEKKNINLKQPRPQAAK